MARRPTIAVVHERFTEHGGSETVVDHLAAIAAEYGDVRVVTAVADEEVLPPHVAKAELVTSPLQRLRRPGGGYAHLLPLLGRAFRSFDLSDADLVVVSHHAFANRIRVPAGIPVVSYVHTPARWLWSAAKRRDESSRLGAAMLGAFAAIARPADRAAAQRPDRLLANSSAVSDRIARWWGRDATVVHPPVDTTYFGPDPAVAREDFVLYAGRVVPYKRPDLAVAAARIAGLPIVVAGDGRALDRCRAEAGPGATFLGRVDDDTMRDLFRRCRVLVLPGEEDFGIVPVEAAACGAPVVAFAGGGAADTVIDGETGLLVRTDLDDAAAADAFAQALRTASGTAFDPLACRSSAERFSVEAFHGRMHEIVGELLTVR